MELLYLFAASLSNYLKPLLHDTHKYFELLRKLTPNGLDEKGVPYDLEVLFTSIPIDVTINYIIYEKEAPKPLCKKTHFFKRFTLGCTFSASLYVKRMVAPLRSNFSMIIAKICMTKCSSVAMISLTIYWRDGCTHIRTGKHEDLRKDSEPSKHPPYTLSLENINFGLE